MKYSCDLCKKTWPCVIDAIGLPEPPYSCLYTNDETDTDAEWKPMQAEPNFDNNTEKRPAATPEPMSLPGKEEVFPELVKDLESRVHVGIGKYGHPLQTHNGRDAINDAYQEVLDLAMYFKQAIMERKPSNEKTLEEKIVQWAEERDLYANSTWETQLSKLNEEIGEWQDEVLSGDRANEMLEIGDMLVVLVNLARIRGFSLIECGWAAYDKIKNRTGWMVNGTFVRDRK